VPASGARIASVALDMIHLEASRHESKMASTGPAEFDCVHVVRTPGELDCLQSRWDLSALDHASPMLHYDWARICADVFCPGCELHIVVAGDGRPTGIAPLFVPRGGLKRLEFLGATELFEPVDFLCADAAAATRLANALVDTGLPVLFNRISADSPTVAAMRDAYRGRGVLIIRPADDYPYIALDDTWTSPEANLNSGRRSDLRRAHRIAASMGEVSALVLSPKPAELRPLLEEAYRVEAGGWKARQGSALATDAMRGSFYSRYAAAACGRGSLRLCFLRIGGRAAAVQLAIEAGNSFWLLKIGYSDEFARCSPGMLLTRETIRYAAAAGLSSYEFLGTVEPWTRVWTPLARRCISLRAYPLSFRGALALAADGGVAALQRLKKAGRREE